MDVASLKFQPDEKIRKIRKLQLTVKKTLFINVLIFMSKMV